MESMEKKRAIKIAVIVASVAVYIIATFLIVWTVQKRACKEEDLRSFDRYILFTDTATGKVYRADPKETFTIVTIPYDGLVHEFTYEVYHIKTNKPYGQSGSLKYDVRGDIAKEPGGYGYEVETIQRGYRKIFDISVTIEAPPKLQPEMKFEPNGAIEYRDGEYYKYKYTGDKCYPIAYGEYNGKRLDANVPPRYLIFGCLDANGEDVYGPIDVGVYKVRFAIAHYKDDPDLEIYDSISKTITIEIVA